MVDGFVPCAGKTYWKIFQIDLGVENSALETNKKTQIVRRLKDRWVALHTYLHSAGSVLDPECRLFLQHEKDEVMSGFLAVVERIFANNLEDQVKTTEQHSKVHSRIWTVLTTCGRGGCYKGNATFLWRPRSWAPESSNARTVLSDVSVCMWAKLEPIDFIHTEKRNKLLCKRVSLLTNFLQ